MPDPDDTISGLPEVIRNSNRPIVIYQGPPPGQFDPATTNALGLLSWLVLLTICLATIGVSVWTVWNPGYEEGQFSPVYEKGRPAGLANRIEERQEINARAEGLLEYLERVRADNVARRRNTDVLPLITDRNGIDDLRGEWDDMCRSIRARIYDRRIGQIDARVSELRARRRQIADPVERARLDGDIDALAQQRRDELDRRRTDSDPALRCVPAAQAPVCSDSNHDAWCNPQLNRPNEFRGEGS